MFNFLKNKKKMNDIDSEIAELKAKLGDMGTKEYLNNYNYDQYLKGGYKKMPKKIEQEEDFEEEDDEDEEPEEEEVEDEEEPEEKPNKFLAPKVKPKTSIPSKVPSTSEIKLVEVVTATAEAFELPDGTKLTDRGYAVWLGNQILKIAKASGV